MNIAQSGIVASLMTLACVAGNAFDDKSHTESPQKADKELTEQEHLQKAQELSKQFENAES